jgi:hypothetical protein
VADEPALDEEDPTAAILAQERTALDRWAQGDPLGYVDIDAEDVTYFDDIGAHTRIDGRASMRSYAASLVGRFHPTDTGRIRRSGLRHIGILTLRYHAYAADASLARWKATRVPVTAGVSGIVHAHWSLVRIGRRSGPEEPARPMRSRQPIARIACLSELFEAILPCLRCGYGARARRSADDAERPGLVAAVPERTGEIHQSHAAHLVGSVAASTVGAEYVVIRYGNFYQVVRPIRGGHVSVA